MSIDSSRRIRMASSADDVFTAICGGTFVYPAVMHEQYQAIRVTNRDGVTPGSIREIAYGHAISRMVSRATEEITRIDHTSRTIESRFKPDGAFVGRFFRSASLVIKVEPLSLNHGPNRPGSTIVWTLTYDSDFNGGLNLNMFQNAIAEGFITLDVYLMSP
ncbi:unnamed protein product [Linum tenue]|uniref:Uncharacterized protein n=2 Tax=Linum tenue TaxID=586396 RepID=A0AAV0L404_9ROSI|nr:unnamed protein product [Linum tenue]